MKPNKTPPPASAFLKEFTHAQDPTDSSSSDHNNKKRNSGGASAIVSNLFGSVGSISSSASGAGGSGSDASSMKHRQESQSYDQRLPKMKLDDDNLSITSNHSRSSAASSPTVMSNTTNSLSAPERGWNPIRRQSSSSDASLSTTPNKVSTSIRSTYGTYSVPSAITPHTQTFGSRFLNFFNPRATDVQQLIMKLQTQFHELEVQIAQYDLHNELDYTDQEHAHRDSSTKTKTSMAVNRSSGSSCSNDPKHPMNNPNLLREIHYVGRSATDPFATQLSNLLTHRDTFGSVTELWLNNNLISDEGASSLASYLELPSCALVELWLGNNKIGPVGTALLSAAMSSNARSQLKCLGLYGNPMGNAGAGCLAQMMRGNHVLVTVDVHGCLYKEDRGESNEVETYGCRVVGGEESTLEKEECVTNQRLLDTIQKFAAFNRINPTREQAIRGLMKAASRKNSASSISTAHPASSSSNPNDSIISETSDSGPSSPGRNSERSEEMHQKKVSQFLSELCVRPGNQRLTTDEKRKWKDCEWEQFQVEMEKAREFKSVLDDRFAIDEDNNSIIDEESGVEDGEGEQVSAP